jgi:poly(3-hydroxybutyrate) depolymerase
MTVQWQEMAGLAIVGALLALAGCGGGDGPPGGGEGAAPPAARLPALPIDPGLVTVSGISSGGAMAVQFHVAHSSLVRGVGALAAPPYLCAEGSLRHALGRCIKDGGAEIPTAQLVERTRQLALDGAIDPVAGLADDRAWLFRGAQDPYVGSAVADSLEAFYRTLLRPDRVARVELPGAGHTFPTRDATAPACDVTEPPFVGNCGLDGAAALLGQLYGDLAPGSAPSADGLVEFDQRPYAEQSGSVGLGDRGWLFVPQACRAGEAASCSLHVVFHGCQQGASFVGDGFVRRAGYLEVAEANRIVLLFPQVEKSLQPLNAYGCWDWWGYEGEDYATRSGRQVRAVRAMVADLLGEATAGR